jgi:hypothetical protein
VAADGPDPTAAAAAAAVALVAALDADALPHVAVELVLAGAASGGQLGMAAYVARRRRAARPRELAVLALGPGAAGPLRFHRTEGLLLPARMHPGLIALAEQVGLPGARRGVTGAIAARRAGWPSLGMSAADGRDRRGATTRSAGGPVSIEVRMIGDTVSDCTELVRALDRQL